MEDLTINTTHGAIGFWGAAGFPERPLVLFIGGAFVPERHVEIYEKAFPDWGFAITHLPGMHSPYFARNAIDLFASAIDEALEQLDHQQVMVVGESLGGLVALAMTSPCVQGRLLLDTPLTTHALWPLHDTLRRFGTLDAQIAGWVQDLLGIMPDGIEDRDYRQLLSTGSAAPVWLVKAEDPLGEPRPVKRTPGLVSPSDEAAYKAAGVPVFTALGSGHGLATQTSGAVQMIRRMASGIWPQVST